MPRLSAQHNWAYMKSYLEVHVPWEGYVANTLNFIENLVHLEAFKPYDGFIW